MIKKRLGILIFTLLAYLLYTEVNVYANSGTKPVVYGYVDNNRMLLPVEIIGESIGADVRFTHNKRELWLTKGNTEVIIYIGQKIVQVNGQIIDISSEPMMSQNVTYIPSRFLIESFNIPARFHQPQSTLQIMPAQNETFDVNIKPITSAYLYQPEIIYSIMYHSFQEGVVTAYTIDPERFRSHLKELKRAGFETITDQDIINYRSNENYRLPEKPLFITIDDGYLDNYTYAYPILREEGMRATIYPIVSNSANNSRGYLTFDQMREMLASGVINIQSHTYDHHHLMLGANGQTDAALITRGPGETHEQYLARIKEDLKLSKEILEDELGILINVLSYPFGIYNRDVERVAKELGFELFITGVPSLNNSNTPEQLVYRYNVHGSYNARRVLNLLGQR